MLNFIQTISQPKPRLLQALKSLSLDISQHNTSKMATTSSTMVETVPSAPGIDAPTKLHTLLTPKPSGAGRLYNQEGGTYGDWRDDLVRDGFCVVKNAVPEERAAQYADEIMSYLENFGGGLGFKRDDPSTVKEANLPIITEKGMIMGYGIAHESFTWAVRQEPGILDAFSKVYDTPDLIVSFDNINVAFPNRKELPKNEAWPHQDQDPARPGFRGMQGIFNILPNGDNDGGLIVCKGAHLLSEGFHEAFKNEENGIWRWTEEWYGFTKEGLAWLKDKGCEWVKVNAGPGDLILWDSRLPHYNLSPEGKTPRLATYVCYLPAAEATREQLERKKQAFDEVRCTTHFPNTLHIGHVVLKRLNGELCQYDTGKPRQPVKLDENGFKLTGIPYLQAASA